MAHESIKMHEIVDRAVSHRWSVPEFQRGFVWKATQVRDLAESLWQTYPIGSLLVWNSQKPQQEKWSSDALSPEYWVVDGQQRATALCILFGRKPYWWDNGTKWEDIVKRYDIRFDVEAKAPPFFHVANAAIRRTKGDRYVPLSRLLVLDIEKAEDQKALEDLARNIKGQGLCTWMDAMEIYTRLDRVRKIRDADVVTITVNHELEDVVEIFSRLNSKGTRVTEADIYLGVVAARAQGWVHANFLPFLNDELKPCGFDIEPNLLFRTVTAIGAKKVRFREIEDSFWNATSIQGAWKRTTTAWKSLVARFREYGILSNDLMPTEAALVTMAALVDKFPTQSFGPALYWFLQASRFGRYSGASATSLEEDLKDINESDSFIAAINKLLRRFADGVPLERDDFLRDYGDTRFGRFFLYLLAYRNKALDWDKAGHRLGFEGAELLVGFRPQWHHVFPRGYMLKQGIAEEKVDALANIAVIGPTINIRISDKSPMDYIARYEIAMEKLAAQYITSDVQSVAPSAYVEWLEARASTLSGAGNAFLDELRQELS